MNPLHPNFLPHQMTPPPRKPLRIAILEADSLNPVARAKYGAYGGMFTAFLHAGADALGWKRDCLCIQGWDVVRVRGVHVGEYPALEDVDAVMITGSRESPLFFFFLSSPSLLFWLPGHATEEGGGRKERKSERNEEKKKEKA